MFWGCKTSCCYCRVQLFRTCRFLWIQWNSWNGCVQFLQSKSLHSYWLQYAFYHCCMLFRITEQVQTVNSVYHCTIKTLYQSHVYVSYYMLHECIRADDMLLCLAYMHASGMRTAPLIMDNVIMWLAMLLIVVSAQFML